MTTSMMSVVYNININDYKACQLTVGREPTRRASILVLYCAPHPVVDKVHKLLLQDTGAPAPCQVMCRCVQHQTDSAETRMT